MNIPSDLEQRDFWNQWNRTYRLKEMDPFMRRQCDIALHWAERHKPRRILDVGCGTGWLAAALSHFGAVTGVDLSPESIAIAREKHPHITFHSGDFVSMPLGGQYELIVSADVIAHVPDQPAFVNKVASLQAPGGLFLLMTQNPFVWNRSSYLRPQGKGQIRDWLPLGEIRQLLAATSRSCISRPSCLVVIEAYCESRAATR